MSDQKIKVKVLGSAQDAGVPQVNCYCDRCQAARQNPGLRRYAASLAIILPDNFGWYLLDATPDLPEQLDLLHTDCPDLGLMRGIFLTHAHIGHYTGLMYLGKEAASSQGILVWAGAGMGDLLRHSAPWSQLVQLGNIHLEGLIPNQSVMLPGGACISPWLVPHRNELSETFAFHVAGPNRKMLFLPDLDRWEQWERSLPEVAQSVDYLLLDATFFSAAELIARGRSYAQIPHPLVRETMALLQPVVDTGKTQVIFIHLNHTNPLLQAGSPELSELLQRGFRVAYEGMEITL